MRKLLRDIANRDEDEGALGRHSVMLASLVILLVALPVGHMLFGSNTRFALILTVVLISSVLVNSRQRWVFIVALLLGIGAVLGIVVAEVSGSESFRIASQFLSLGLLGMTTLVMLISLLRAEQVSLDTIIGGVCVYLLIGLCFAVIYILMVDLSPGAFIQGDHAIVRVAADSSAHSVALLYFSFVTITTLGYGDVRPHVEIAQMFAAAEAVIGQLYLTIFLARLIASYVARDRIGEGSG
jgi:hypothetical protein